jgi:hypothetical protein
MRFRLYLPRALPSFPSESQPSIPQQTPYEQGWSLAWEDENDRMNYWVQDLVSQRGSLSAK